MSNRKFFNYAAIIVGNCLDHFNTALYLYMAPIIAPLFFPDIDPLLALIYSYGIKMTRFISRPLGSIFFAHLAQKYRLDNLLAITLGGVSICTLSIGCLPTHISIGQSAACLLVLIKFIKGFFASGENAISSLYSISKSPSLKQGKSSSIYLFSTMMGTLLASLAAWLVSISSDPQFYWRIPFLLGMLTGLAGLFVRLNASIVEYKEYEKEVLIEKQNLSSLQIVNQNKWSIIKTIPITSFALITYSIPFAFLNFIAPEIANIELDSILAYNTLLVAFNNILILICGKYIDNFNITKWMRNCALLFAFTIIPAFGLINYLGHTGLIAVKIWIIAIGVCFSTPLNAYLYKLAPMRKKYLVSGISYTIGTEILGRSTTLICLFLWKYFESIYAPAIYVALIALIAGLCFKNS